MRPLFVTLLALALSLPGLGQVDVVQKPDRISVSVNGEPFTEFFIAGEDVAKPYFHPLRAASGTIVSRQYPMAIVEGESKDHPHHRGLWFAHGDVNSSDFWSADPSREGDRHGTIELEKVVSVKSGEESGSLEAIFVWKASDGKELVRETRRARFHASPADLRVMDLEIELEGIVDAHFGDTKEGTFAIRVADSMNERNSGTLLNARGMTGEKNVWGKRSPYMDYFGEVHGERYGIAVFDHPKNPKHPTYWHVRAYGLLAANIFGEHDFHNDESRDGGMTLAGGDTWTFRYRVVIHHGDAKSAGIDKLYREYASGQ